MKKFCTLLLVILGVLLCAGGALAASEKDVLRLDEEDILNNRDGKQVSFSMMSSRNTKEIFIDEEAIDYLIKNHLDLTIKTPKVTMSVPSRVFQVPEWDAAVKTGEPVTAKLILAKGNLSKVADNFDEWYYNQIGFYRLNNVAYELKAEILVAGVKKYELAELAAPLALEVNYPANSVTAFVREDRLGCYFLNEDSGKWIYAGGEVNPEANIINCSVSQTGLFTFCSDNRQESSSAGKISDITGHWAESDILFMQSKNIIRELEENKFFPNREITRAEFVAFLVRTLKVPVDSQGDNAFQDVLPGAPYYQEIMAGVDAGLVSGVGAAKFAPARKITREEIAALLVRAYKYAGQTASFESGVLDRFSDRSDISSWAKDSVATAVQVGLISGRGDSLFVPKAATTRAEAVVMLHRLLGKVN
jgi:hypothetical protein